MELNWIELNWEKWIECVVHVYSCVYFCVWSVGRRTKKLETGDVYLRVSELVSEWLSYLYRREASRPARRSAYLHNATCPVHRPHSPAETADPLSGSLPVADLWEVLRTGLPKHYSAKKKGERER